MSGLLECYFFLTVFITSSSRRYSASILKVSLDSLRKKLSTWLCPSAMTSHFSFFFVGIVGGGVQLGLLDTAATNGLLCRPRVIMMMEKLVEWLAGETEVLLENLPQYRFVHHKPHMLPGREPGPPRWKPATNRLSYGTACRIFVTKINRVKAIRNNLLLATRRFAHMPLQCLCIRTGVLFWIHIWIRCVQAGRSGYQYHELVCHVLWETVQLDVMARQPFM
jgi:hypothetical protein